jgi:hypothetical protein
VYVLYHLNLHPFDRQKSKNRRVLMKKMLRILSLLLALLMVLTAFGAMIGCGEDPVPPPAPGPEDPDGPTPPAPGPDGKATYTVSVKSIGGRAFADLRFFVYEGDALKGYGTTNANGIGTVSLVPSTGYTVELVTYAE